MQRHPKLGAASIALGLGAVAVYVPSVMKYPGSLFHPAALGWATMQVLLIVAGVLLLIGHSRGYFAGFVAWAMAVVFAVAELARDWSMLERGRHVLWERPAFCALVAVFGIGAMAYLFAKSRARLKGGAHAV